MPLDHLFRRDDSYSLRWIYLYLIKEYARYLGHADLLRERIDGAAGERGAPIQIAMLRFAAGRHRPRERCCVTHRPAIAHFA
jgi:hypothetical protein